MRYLQGMGCVKGWLELVRLALIFREIEGQCLTYLTTGTTLNKAGSLPKDKAARWSCDSGLGVSSSLSQ